MTSPTKRNDARAARGWRAHPLISAQSKRLAALALTLLLGGCGPGAGNASVTRAGDSGTTLPGGAVSSSAIGAQPAAPRDRCTVQAVTDGDSFRCTDGRRVRLLLLDAPEMSQVPFGARSRDALRARMPRGGTVWLEYDVQRLDRYDRTLAYAWTEPTGGELINELQARNGWAVAVVFPPNVRRIEAIRAAVAAARRENRGLWGDGGFRCEPIEHKRGRC